MSWPNEVTKILIAALDNPNCKEIEDKDGNRIIDVSRKGEWYLCTKKSGKGGGVKALRCVGLAGPFTGFFSYWEPPHQKYERLSLKFDYGKQYKRILNAYKNKVIQYQEALSKMNDVYWMSVSVYPYMEPDGDLEYSHSHHTDLLKEEKEKRQ